MTRRLLLAATALVAVVVIVLTIPLAVTVEQAARDRLAAAVERDATVIAGFAEDHLEVGAPADLDRIVEAYQDRTGGRVVIVDADGIAVADSAVPGTTSGGRDFSTRPEVAAALRGEISTGSRFSQTLDDGFLYVAVPAASGGVVHGAVRISYPTAAVDARIGRSRLLLLATGLTALTAAGIVGVVIGRWIVAPLGGLERAARRLAAGDLQARAPDDAGPPELRRLAATVNVMAGRVEELIATQRTFIGDASHQLRTPLTALRLRLEGLEMGADADDAAELEAAIDEVFRLNRLVDGLLTLVRADSARPAAGAVDAAAAVRERAAIWEPLAAEQQVGIEVQVPDDAPVLAVEEALPQILDNLLANALRFAPPDSTIWLTVEHEGDHTLVSVADEGPGIPQAERDRAFDRFWRAGAADDDGFGLGLAIVQRLVTASGGQVRLHERPGGGLLVAITLRNLT